MASPHLSPLLASEKAGPPTAPAAPASAVGTAPAGAPPRPLRVCLLISSLEYGGAERQVIEMTRTFDRTTIDPLICTLSDKIPLVHNDPDIRALVHTVAKRGRYDVTMIPRLARFFRRHQIDVVHAFLFDAEIAARLAAPLAGVPVVIASERNADYVRRRLHQLVQRATKPLFDVMVANSHAGARFNIRTLGLDESRLRVVHNGVDTARFQPDEAAGLAFRGRIGIRSDEPVVGMVGSFKRQKDHATFLRMAAGVLRSLPNCRFVIAGDVISGSPDSAAYAEEIREFARELDLGERCLFLGNQDDMAGFYNACDLTALLSLREGTPNVALESMACGVPVIASDIADNAFIIRDGETGHIVPAGADGLAAERVTALLQDPGRLRAMGHAARDRICAEFSPQRAAGKLADIYLERHAASKSRTFEKSEGLTLEES